MADNVFILGKDNVVESDVENLMVFNASGETFTSEDNNINYLNGRGVYATEYGIHSLVIQPTETKSTSFTTGNVKTYFIDATSGDRDVLIAATGIDYTFVRLDNSTNTIFLVPQSGLINGDTDYELTTQYQKVTVVWDGTNYYV